jgi:type I restriction-modification system DNA methylase subunit
MRTARQFDNGTEQRQLWRGESQGPRKERTTGESGAATDDVQQGVTWTSGAGGSRTSGTERGGTGVGGTDQVWFYDVRADGWSLDDKRQPLLPDDKLGPTPAAVLTEAEAARNDLPDLVRRWGERAGTERTRPRTAQSFCVPKRDIAAAGYDLSLNRYKQVEHEEVEHESPAAILADLRRIEAEIAAGTKHLEEMVG